MAAGSRRWIATRSPPPPPPEPSFHSPEPFRAVTLASACVASSSHEGDRPMTGLVLSRRSALALGCGGIALAARPAWAFATDEAAVDAIVRRFMREFEIPGIGVAVVRTGEAPFTRG